MEYLFDLNIEYIESEEEKQIINEIYFNEDKYRLGFLIYCEQTPGKKKVLKEEEKKEEE